MNWEAIAATMFATGVLTYLIISLAETCHRLIKEQEARNRRPWE